jgi:hypothetical protein
MSGGPVTQVAFDAGLCRAIVRVACRVAFLPQAGQRSFDLDETFRGDEVLMR